MILKANRLLNFCSCCLAALWSMSDARAGAFAIRQQSAYGLGASFAGIAAGGSLSSMFWNPANLSDVRRIEIEVVGTGVFVSSDVKLDPEPLLGFPGSDEGNIGKNPFIPAGYVAYRLSDRVVLGVAVNSLFGLVTE